MCLLSLFAPYFTYKVTMEKSNVDHNEVYAAKLCAARGFSEVQLQS